MKFIYTLLITTLSLTINAQNKIFYKGKYEGLKSACDLLDIDVSDNIGDKKQDYIVSINVSFALSS